MIDDYESGRKGMKEDQRGLKRLEQAEIDQNRQEYAGTIWNWLEEPVTGWDRLEQVGMTGIG